jgi:hypothetical protein
MGFLLEVFQRLYSEGSPCVEGALVKLNVDLSFYSVEDFKLLSLNKEFFGCSLRTFLLALFE